MNERAAALAKKYGWSFVSDEVVLGLRRFITQAGLSGYMREEDEVVVIEAQYERATDFCSSHRRALVERADRRYSINTSGEQLKDKSRLPYFAH